MFDKKQIQNIRNTYFKYVTSAKMRSQIAWLAQTLSEEEDDGPQRDAIYWSTIWYCSLPENRDEFKKMFQELTADGSMMGLEEAERPTEPNGGIRRNAEMTEMTDEELPQ